MSEDTYVGTISKHEMVVDRYDYEYMEEEIKRLTNVVGRLVSQEKWDGSDLGTKLEYKLEPRK